MRNKTPSSTHTYAMRGTRARQAAIYVPPSLIIPSLTPLGPQAQALNRSSFLSPLGSPCRRVQSSHSSLPKDTRIHSPSSFLLGLCGGVIFPLLPAMPHCVLCLWQCLRDKERSRKTRACAGLDTPPLPRPVDMDSERRRSRAKPTKKPQKERHFFVYVSSAPCPASLPQPLVCLCARFGLPLWLCCQPLFWSTSTRRAPGHKQRSDLLLCCVDSLYGRQATLFARPTTTYTHTHTRTVAALPNDHACPVPEESGDKRAVVVRCGGEAEPSRHHEHHLFPQTTSTSLPHACHALAYTRRCSPTRHSRRDSSLKRAAWAFASPLPSWPPPPSHPPSSHDSLPSLPPSVPITTTTVTHTLLFI